MDIEELDDVVNEPQPPVMDTILTWIGFKQEATDQLLLEEGFESIADVLALKEKDVRDLADSYGRRTVTDAGRSIFGLRRTRYLIGHRTNPLGTRLPEDRQGTDYRWHS